MDFACYVRALERRGGAFAGESAYLNDIPAIRALDTLDLSGAPVTFFVGKNGSGKSTLLEAVSIAAGCNPEGGSRHQRFATADTHAALHERLRLIRGPVRERDAYFLRAESFYNVATHLASIDDTGFAGYGGRPLHARSHGESFLALVQHRLGGNGLYLFDEPEAALSPSRQMALLCNLHALVQARSQLLIATHSPVLLSYPHAVIYELGEHGIRRVAYRETEAYTVLHGFLNAPERMLALLLDEG